MMQTRFAFGWLTVGIKLTQNRFIEDKTFSIKDKFKPTKPIRYFFKFVWLLFHENGFIFLMPLIGIILYSTKIDLRFLYCTLGSFILLPSIIYEFYTFFRYNRLDKTYYEIASNSKISDTIKTIYFK